MKRLGVVGSGCCRQRKNSKKKIRTDACKPDICWISSCQTQPVLLVSALWTFIERQSIGQSVESLQRGKEYKTPLKNNNKRNPVACPPTHEQTSVWSFLPYRSMNFTFYFLWCWRPSWENIVKTPSQIRFFFMQYVKSSRLWDTFIFCGTPAFSPDHVLFDIKLCIPMKCVQSNYIWSSPSITTSTKNTRRKICWHLIVWSSQLILSSTSPPFPSSLISWVNFSFEQSRLGGRLKGTRRKLQWSMLDNIL